MFGQIELRTCKNITPQIDIDSGEFIPIYNDEIPLWL
jgi:hypothetical protein